MYLLNSVPSQQQKEYFMYYYCKKLYIRLSTSLLRTLLCKIPYYTLSLWVFVCTGTVHTL
jgi:hypothetical protein